MINLYIYIYMCVCMCVYIYIHTHTLLYNYTSYKVAQTVKNLLLCKRRGFNPWVGKIPWRSEFPFTSTHSSILDWRIPWTEEPGRL